jgi:hypothetical protein
MKIINGKIEMSKMAMKWRKMWQWRKQWRQRRMALKANG